MRLKFLFGFFLAVFLNFNFTEPASACGPCEYEDGTLRICLPKGGCLIPRVPDPVKVVVKLGDALRSGDVGKVSEALGDVLTNSPSCIGCAYVAEKIAPNLTPDQRNRIIGQGFLTFLATGDPVLVVIDVATNLATQQPLGNIDPGLPSPPVPPQRGNKTYSGTADCILQRGTEIYAGWKAAPMLKDTTTGIVFTYPEIDLLKDDTLVISSRECTEWNDASTGQRAISSIVLKYNRSSTVPGGASLIKYYLIGSPVMARTTQN